MRTVDETGDVMEALPAAKVRADSKAKAVA
jgi:hypothetical protein